MQETEGTERTHTRVPERLVDTAAGSQLSRESQKTGSVRRINFRARADLSDEKPFWKLAHQVAGHNRTLLGIDRLYTLWQSVRNVQGLRLPAAEVGAYKGGSAYFIASAFAQLAGSERPLLVIDTFAGHPGAKVSKHDTDHQVGMFGDVQFDEVQAYLAPFKKLRLLRGEFSELITSVEDTAYCFVHLDVDLYETTLDGLQYFGARLVPGSIMVIDDYGADKCPGVRKAVARYLRHTPQFYGWNVLTEQFVMVRR